MKFQVFFFVWNFGSLFLGPRVCKGSLFHEHWVSIWSRSLFLYFEVSYKLKHCSHSAYDWHKRCLWQIPRPVEILPCPPLPTMSPLFSMAAQSPFSILTFKPKNSLFRNFHLIFTFMADALFPRLENVSHFPQFTRILPWNFMPWRVPRRLGFFISEMQGFYWKLFCDQK